MRRLHLAPGLVSRWTKCILLVAILQATSGALAQQASVSVMTTLVVDSGVTPDQFEPWFQYLSDRAEWLGRSFPAEKQRFHQPHLKVAEWSRLEKILVKKLQHAGVPLLADRMLARLAEAG